MCLSVRTSLACPQQLRVVMYLVNAMYLLFIQNNSEHIAKPAVKTKEQDRSCTALKVHKHLRAHTVFRAEHFQWQ